MAVRLREADSMAAMAELRQKMAELEIQVDVPARGRVLWLRFIVRLWMFDPCENCFSRRKKGW